MKNFKLPAGLTRSLSKATITLKKHSPEIMVVAGVVGTVASAVMACRATTKVSTVLDKAKEDIATIHDVAASPEFAEEYTVEDSKKDLTIVYAKTGVELVKLYAPSVILGALSITSILTSHHIMRKRNLGLAAAYAAVDKGFKEYRGRVVERFGETVDRELKYNIKAKEIEETVVDEKTGKEKKVKKTVQTTDFEFGKSPYAKFFDEFNSSEWTRDYGYNQMFVRARQSQANDELRASGHLFLNDVYKMLGMDPTPEGQIVGWIYDPEDGSRNSYVDFGLTDIYRPGVKEFVDGYERSILLDFNVDGDIWSLMKTRKYKDKFSK